MNRRLVRSRTDTVLGGVAAGLADYLNTDPALVRIAWAILVPLTGGAAFLAYIVAWIVVPEAPRADDGGEAVPLADAEGDASPARPADERGSASDGRAGLLVGLGLVLLGVWFLARQYLPAIDWSLIWPLILVGIGVLILVTSSRGTR